MTRYDKAYFKKIGALLDQIIENESDLMEGTRLLSHRKHITVQEGWSLLNRSGLNHF